MNARPRIFVVDDEANIRASLRLILAREGYQVADAGSMEEARRHAHWLTSEGYLIDVRLPDGDGVELLGELRAQGVAAPVVMISGHATVALAVAATRAGAYDFLEKPLARDRVLVALKNALAAFALDRENRRLRELAGAGGRLVGASPALLSAVAQVRRAAPSDVTVLLEGETGTGKELLATLLHEESQRAGGPFVKVNCAAIPGELVESELFGHERGAFTGAGQSYRGRFEQADKGTLFLDEVGDLAAAAQAKLLRVLEDGRFHRLGGEREIEVSVRVVAATHRDLEAMARDGAFRSDLLYRLRVMPVRVPPLRERREDIAALARHFASEFARRNSTRPKEMSAEVLAALEAHDWPGNARELRNTVERMMILAPGAVLTAAELPRELRGPAGEGKSGLRGTRDEAEREYLTSALNEHGWNVSAAARALGLERTHVHKRIRALGLRREG
jgi:two-component system, NtrC family, nitrogen regulation response regulator NtrX